MKISKIIYTITLISLLGLSSCGDSTSKKINDPKQNNGNHGHSHGPNGHQHDEVTDQEEFIVEENILKGNDSSEPTETIEANDLKQENTTTIIVPAKKALEYKFKINKHERLTYEWIADTPILSDFHGDPNPEEGFKKGYYESYTIATSNKMKGTTTVPYSGSHGWYWKNESNEDVTISLKTQGNYKIIGIIK